MMILYSIKMFYELCLELARKFQCDMTTAVCSIIQDCTNNVGSVYSCATQVYGRTTERSPIALEMK